MVSQEAFKKHWNDLYDNKAIYVWGANCETITKELMEELYDTYGSDTYNERYYNNKFQEGKGKIGADCSGAIYPLSKRDDTVLGYYKNQCINKGYIDLMPMDSPCLVFNASFTHVGAYLGDGITIEMASSVKNCVKSKFDNKRWCYYGVPSWLEIENIIESSYHAYVSSNTIIYNIQKWINNYLGKDEVTVNGNFDLPTEKGLCKCLQKCLVEKYNAPIAITGSFTNETKQYCKLASSCYELTYVCQCMLYHHNIYMTHSIKKNGTFDGEYGPGMKRSILEYQRKTRGLLQDGICGPATFNALFNG